MKELNENNNSLNKIEEIKINENEKKNSNNTFNKLKELQELIKKESSIKELCKIKYIFLKYNIL